MQFLSENRLNMSNFWKVWFLETESEQNFGFPHIPTEHILSRNYSVNNRTTAVFGLICISILTTHMSRLYHIRV